MARKPKLTMPSSAIAPVMAEVITVETLELTTAADRINQWQLEIDRLTQQSLIRALAIGWALEQVKALLPHGGLGPWIAENTRLKPNTARIYRNLWERRTEMFSALGLDPIPDEHLLPAVTGETVNAFTVLPPVSVRQAITQTRLYLKTQACSPESAVLSVPLTLWQRRLTKGFDQMRSLRDFVAKLPTQTPEIQRIQRDLEKLMADLKAAIATLPD